MRSKVQTITPSKAERWLELNTANRPTSKPVVHSFAEVMARGDWKITHQGNAAKNILAAGQAVTACGDFAVGRSEAGTGGKPRGITAPHAA